MFKGRRILVSTLASVAAVLFISACGQRGPLYLPTDPAAADRASLPQTLNPVPSSAKAPDPATLLSSPSTSRP